MASIEEQSRDLLLDIRDSLRRGGSGSSSSPSSAGTTTFSATPTLNLKQVEGFTDALGNAATGLNMLHTGTLNAGNALHLLSSGISTLGPIGKTIGGLTDTFGSSIINANENINKFGRNGANWNNDLAAMDKAVLGSRMTQEQYGEMVGKSANALSGLGSTINRSQANYLEFSKQFQESDFANKLKEMGLSAEEVNEVALATMSNRKGLDLSTAQAQRQAMDAAIGLTSAMEETTRITGMSRQEQANELKTRTENVVVQASLMQLDKDSMNRYLVMQQGLQGLGKGVKDVADEIFTGGIRTKEGAAKFAALGPAGADLEKAVLASKNARTTQDKMEADAAMKRAEASINEYQRSKSFLDMVSYGKGAPSDAARQMMGENKEMNAILAKVEEVKTATGKAPGVEEAQKGQSQEVRRNMQGLDATGKAIDTAGSTVAKTINDTNRSLKDLAAGTSDGFGKLIQTTAGVNDKFKELTGLDLQKLIQPRTQEQAAALIPNAASAVKSKLSLHDAEEAGSHLKSAGEVAAPLAKPPTKEFADGTPNFQNFLSSGGFGSMFDHFDPKGEPVELHGNELVANESQMKQLFSMILPSKPANDKAKTNESPATAITPPEIAEPAAEPTTPPTSVTDKGAESDKSKTALTEVDKVFSTVNKEMTNVTKELSGVTDRLKSIKFDSIATEISSQITKTFDIQHEKAAKIEPKKEEPKQEAPKVEPKKEESKQEAPKVEPKKEEPKKEEPKQEAPKQAEVITPTDKFEKLSKVIDSVSAEIESGGIRTKEGAQKMAALGPAGADLEKAILAHKNATTDQQKADAIIAENNAVSRIKDYQSSKEFIDLQKVSATEQKDESVKYTTTEPEKPKEEKYPIDNMISTVANQFKTLDLGSMFNGVTEKIGPMFENMFADEKPTEVPEDQLKMIEDIRNKAMEQGATAQSTFSNITNQIGETFAKQSDFNFLTPESMRDIANETKAPDYMSIFDDMNEQLSSANEISLTSDEEDEEDLDMFGELPDLSSTFSDMSDSIGDTFSEMMPDMSEEPVEEESKEEDSGFFGKMPKLDTMFSDVGTQITNMFKVKPAEPLAPNGNVKYEQSKGLSDEEKAAKLKEMNTPDQIAARKMEHARQEADERRKQDELAKAAITKMNDGAIQRASVKTPEEPAKANIKSHEEHGSAIANEIKNNIAQIKPAEYNQATLTKDTFKQPPAPEPVKPAEPPKPPEQTPAELSNAASIKALEHIHEAIIELNKNIQRMSTHTEALQQTGQKQIKATKSLSGNRFA